MKRRIISIIMAIVFVMSFCTVTASAQESSVCNQNFNSLEVGQSAVEGFTGGSVYAFPSAGNKSFGTDSNIYNSFTAAESGSVVISYDFFLTSYSPKRIMQIYGTDTSKGDERPAVIYTESDGRLTADGALAAYYPINKWFNVTLVMDIDNRVYDIYVDRQLCIASRGFWQANAKKVGIIQTAAGQRTYIDNVLVQSGFDTKSAATIAAEGMLKSSVYSENTFDSRPSNANVTNVKGFSVQGTVSNIITADFPSATDKSFKFVGGNGVSWLWNELNTKATAGGFVVSYDFYFKSLVSARILEIYGDYGIGDTRTANIGVNSDGKFLVNNNRRDDFTYSIGKWYNVSLVYDLDNKKFYIYIDGVCVDANGFSYFKSTANSIGFIKTLYEAAPSVGGEMYVDNMYAESFSSLAAANAVFEARKNMGKACFGESESGKAYQEALLGYLGTYRAVSSDNASKSTAMTAISSLNNDLSAVYVSQWADDFEKYDDNTEIIATPYIDGYYYTQSSPTVVTVDGEKAVELTNSGTRARFINKIAGAPTAFRVSFDFMQKTISNISCLGRTTNSEGNQAALELYTENGNICMRCSDENRNQKNVTLFRGYKENLWYNISYYVDLQTQTFSIAVNGNECSNSNYGFFSNFISASGYSLNLKKVFDTYTAVAGTYYVDNVSIYSDSLYGNAFTVEMPDRILSDMTLPLPSAQNAQYSWSSSVEGLVNNGVLTRNPEQTQNPLLTLNASYGDFSSGRSYSVLIPSDSELSAIITNVKNMLSIPESIASTIIAFPQSTDSEVNILWTSSDTAVIDNNGNVTLPVNTNAAVTLTAEFSYVGAPSIAHQTRQFNVIVKGVNDYATSDVIYEDASGNETRGITENGKINSVYLEKASSAEGKLICAAYSGDTLTQVYSFDATNGFNSVNAALPSGTTDVKYYVWNGLSQLKPLAKKSALKNDNITFWMIGDSMMATYDPEKTTRVGWGSIFNNWFDSNHVTVNNDNAHPGYTMKLAISNWCFNNILDGMKQGDYVFVSFGHNDQKDPEMSPATNGGYQQYLAKFADAVRKRGGQMIFVTSIERCDFKDGVTMHLLGDYAASMKELGANIGVPVIDVNTMTNNYLNEVGYDVAKNRYMIAAENDSTHLNGEGSAWVCDYVADWIETLGLPVSEYIIK